MNFMKASSVSSVSSVGEESSPASRTEERPLQRGKPPGPRHPAAWSTWRWLNGPYAYLDDLHRRFGDTFTMPIVGFNIVVFSNPDDVKEIFSDNGEIFEAGRFNQTLAPLLGDRSVLMVDGKAHRRKRKLLLPPFHGERMQAYGQTMLDITDDGIDAFPIRQPFALHGFMQDITLRVIVRTIFGFEGARQDEMVKSTKRLLELGAWAPLLLSFMQVDLGRFSPYGRFRRAVAASDEILYAEIERRRSSGARGSDILSLLLDARDEDGKPMGAEELRDELVTLLVAGHETTATGLTWAMRWLLESPSLVRELKEEIESMGPNPSPAAIAKSELLDGVAREALRLVPIIPLVGRVLARDQVVGGYALKKDTPVVCSIYLAHRRAAAYPRASEFDPKRFLGKKMSAYEFFPFGGGTRRCIGMAFALYEMKMVLARLLARLHLELEGRAPVRMVRRSITITPSEGLRVIATKRSPRPEAAAAE